MRSITIFFLAYSEVDQWPRVNCCLWRRLCNSERAFLSYKFTDQSTLHNCTLSRLREHDQLSSEEWWMFWKTNITAARGSLSALTGPLADVHVVDILLHSTSSSASFSGHMTFRQTRAFSLADLAGPSQGEAEMWNREGDVPRPLRKNSPSRSFIANFFRADGVEPTAAVNPLTSVRRCRRLRFIRRFRATQPADAGAGRYLLGRQQ